MTDVKMGTSDAYGAGNDTYYVDSAGDIIVEALRAGTDKVNSYIDYTLNADVEKLYLYGAARKGTGNDLNNDIFGTGSNDTLAGLGGNDRLYGKAGNDFLDGGKGSDYLYGGKGNDTYIVENESDVVYEALDAGTDEVKSYSYYHLDDNVENLSLHGTAASGAGNSLNNIIIGNSYENHLSGEAGADHLYGYEGVDMLDGGSGSDYLYGGTGNDFLDGGRHDDFMYGEEGNDTYSVDSTGDTIFEALNAGTDKVKAYVDYTLEANVENLTLYGLTINGSGNELSNKILGNRNANILNGLDGDDMLYGLGDRDILNGGSGDDRINGGSGNDILTGGDGADYFDFTNALNAKTNKDTITDFSAVDDTIRLENNIMPGLGAATEELAAGAFHSGTVTIATEADDRIIYNISTGALYYDADGTGPTAAVKIAVIGSTIHPELTNADFMVI